MAGFANIDSAINTMYICAPKTVIAFSLILSFLDSKTTSFRSKSPEVETSKDALNERDFILNLQTTAPSKFDYRWL